MACLMVGPTIADDEAKRPQPKGFAGEGLVLHKRRRNMNVGKLPRAPPAENSLVPVSLSP